MTCEIPADVQNIAARKSLLRSLGGSETEHWVRIGSAWCAHCNAQFTLLSRDSLCWKCVSEGDLLFIRARYAAYVRYVLKDDVRHRIQHEMWWELPPFNQLPLFAPVTRADWRRSVPPWANRG